MNRNLWKSVLIVFVIVAGCSTVVAVEKHSPLVSANNDGLSGSTTSPTLDNLPAESDASGSQNQAAEEVAQSAPTPETPSDQTPQPQTVSSPAMEETIPQADPVPAVKQAAPVANPSSEGKKDTSSPSTDVPTVPIVTPAASEKKEIQPQETSPEKVPAASSPTTDQPVDNDDVKIDPISNPSNDKVAQPENESKDKNH